MMLKKTTKVPRSNDILHRYPTNTFSYSFSMVTLHKVAMSRKKLCLWKLLSRDVII